MEKCLACEELSNCRASVPMLCGRISAIEKTLFYFDIFMPASAVPLLKAHAALAVFPGCYVTFGRCSKSAWPAQPYAWPLQRSV